jgi:hypothetical protein
MSAPELLITAGLLAVIAIGLGYILRRLGRD